MKTLLNQFSMNDFVFIITAYNNRDWASKCLQSVNSQKNRRFRIIYTDDCSNDGSDAVAYNLLSKNRNSVMIRNKVRKGQGFNRFSAVRMCYSHEICVILDGDDWLLHDEVLDILDSVYKKDVKATYGQYRIWQDNNFLSHIYGIQEYDENTRRDTLYRQKPFFAWHLRTAYAELWKLIPASYLKVENEWLDCCTDIAEMFCILELSEGKHCNIGSPVYAYNADASKRFPGSWFRDRYGKRKKIESILRKYQPLKGR
jgi:glycosyltransferase involved in cell wall biosynthesis